MRSMVDSLSGWEAERPDKVAYRFLQTGDVDGEIGEITFGGLARRSRAIGGWLQERGFAGSRALLLYPPGLEFVSGYMGCLFGGVIAAPCPAPQAGNFDRELPRLKSLVADAGAELVLSTEPVLSELRAMASTVPELASLTWIATEDIPDEAEREWRHPAIRPDSISFLQYTSGSTSAPRGVMVTHANLMDQQRVLADLLGHAPERLEELDGDLIVSWLPVFHDLGLIGVVIHAAYLGETAVMFPPGRFVQKPERWVTAVSEYRARSSGGPNFAFELCLRRATTDLVERLDLSRWRCAYNCAEPVRASTLRRFAEVFAPAGFRRQALLPSYGLAEATLAVTGGSLEEDPKIIPAPGASGNAAAGAPRELVGVGHARPGMTVVVVDRERAVPCAEGEEGEVWVAGASVAPGYWNNEQATEELFDARLPGDAKRYLRTGDLGFLREGELYVTGRAKDLVIVDGRNHYPQDLELTAELAHPAVRPGCIAAFSVEDEAGERPVLVAEVATAPPPDTGEVERAIRQAVDAAHGLALHAVVLIRPRTIFKTSSGKIQRHATRNAYLDGSLATITGTETEQPPSQPDAPARDATAPGTARTPEAVEAWLVAALARRLRVEPEAVDRERPLSDYGLGSRPLVELAGQLGEWLGRDLEPTILYDHPTIARAARALGQEVVGAPARRSERRSDPIAIVSMSCRFPGGANSPEELWRLLADAEDAVGEPPGRWDVDALLDPDPDAVGKAYTLQGGYLRDIDRFDAAFFGISPREAAAMDPQQRLLLETSWEAFERAGIRPDELADSATGVYVGLYDSGYSATVGLDELEGHTSTGAAASVASGRIAYTLGLQGPAVTLDTACSSSLVAVHMAAQALRAGECDLALAGGATVMVTPRAFVEFSRLRGLSASGRCRSFSADADGMVWAEGCGWLLLKRLSDAERDGDRVLALVAGSAVNQDGRSQGLSAPNGLAQERVIRAALDAAELRPEDLDYVEAHGTGTPLGDPIEGRALTRAFGPSRPPGRPLYVGSLKSNVGHTQAAAGVGGVIKTVLALQHEEIPASLHAEIPTSQIDWSGGLEVASESVPWRRGSRPRRAGVSSFGISGTNAHVIVTEAPEFAPARRASRPGDAGPLVFPVSARSPAALAGQAERLADALAAQPELGLESLARTLGTRRTHFERRAAVVAAGRDDLLTALRDLRAGRPSERVLGPRDELVSGKLAFVFPGQGSQWVGMATDLLARSRAFRHELRRCDDALRPHTGWTVASVLRGESGAPDLDRVDVVQPVLFGVMVALAAVWRSFGIEPDAVIGHSQGEVAAACIAGALTLKDAAKVVALRSRAISAVGGSGAMAVVGLPHGELERRLAARGGGVSVAAINSARATVLAGAPDELGTLLEELDAEGTFARRLQVDYASHSAAVEPLRETILGDLDGVASTHPSVRWYSTLLGEAVDGQRVDAEYWYRNLREPVLFATAVERALEEGCRYFVELSPHPSLLIAVETVAEDAGKTAVALGSLRREADGLDSLARSLGELHVAGCQLRWDLLTPEAPDVELPTYAFEATRHWIEPREPGRGAPGGREEHPLLGTELESAASRRWIFRKAWSRATAAWLGDHAVFDRVVLSGTTVAELCRSAAEVASPDRPADLAELLLMVPVVLSPAASLEVQVEVAGTEEGELEVSVYSRPRGDEGQEWTLHATALAAPATELTDEVPPGWPEDGEPAWTEATYSRLAESGIAYGPAFQGVEAAVASGPDEVLARLALPAPARDERFADRLHPALLDAALQVAASFDREGRVLVPVAVARSSLRLSGAERLTARVRRAGEAGGDLLLDATLWSDDGLVAGTLSGIRMRSVVAADFSLAAGVARDLYAVRWTPVEPDSGAAEGRWAVVADDGDPVAAAALDALVGAGVAATLVRPGESLPPALDTVVRSLPATAEEASLADRAEELTTECLAELAGRLERGGREHPARVVWLTSGAVATGTGDPAGGLAGAPLWGLARSARAEHPDLGLSLVDVGGEPARESLLAALRAGDEPELAVRGELLLAPRLARAATSDEPAAPAADAYPSDGTVLVTGGLGAIGARIARRLAERGVPRLLLTSRRGREDPRAPELVAQLSALGAEAEVVACDVADAADLGALIDGIDPSAPLRGVVHCAGVLADAVLADQSPERLEAVMRPKVHGAWNLHQLTRDHPIALFVLLSSAAGVLGSPGQSNYAAANVFLDQLAERRRALGLPATSVSFGPWAGGGLAEENLGRVASLGFAPLAPDHGVDLLELTVRRRASHLLAMTVDLDRVRASQAQAGRPPALWRSLLPEAPVDRGAGALSEGLARMPEGERAERVLTMVREEAARALGLSSGHEIRPDQALGEVGLDSVMALQLRNRLAARFGVRLPATLLFDRPAPRDLAEHLLTTVVKGRERSTARPAPRAVPEHRPGDEPIAIVSMACRLPGGATSPEELWQLLAGGRDAIGPFPSERWDVDALFDPDPDALGKSYAREGGFLPRIDAFDARFFGITPREAMSMDPQQRLLLETAWEVLERAGMVPGDLAGSVTGVYLGMLGSDYAAGPSLSRLDGYLGTGTALSVASGRLAYTLGLVGPALTVDTACSSSLLALHLAAGGLRSGECEMALVGGATVMTTPRTFVEFSRLRGLSPSGRCRSFSDDADGTGFSEGVAMLVAKRLSDARRDGDDVLAVVRGSAVNQDGRSQGLSVPFGPSQERVIREALERSSLAPADIDYVEAHGTGTTLGDPIEANALAQVFGGERPPDRPLHLGSIKSNLGHLQATAGLAGVMKLVLSLGHERIPPTLHVTEPTRHVEWEESGLRLARETVTWERGERPRRAGVSAFGISGTNVHAVIEEAPRPAAASKAPPAKAPPARAATPGKLPFVVSARDDAALARQAERLAASVAELPEAALADVAHTLARHRTHFERRAVVLTRHRDSLLEALDALAAGGAHPDLVGPPAGEPVTGKVAFVFPGHSPRWAGMGLDLLEGSEPFAGALERCDAALRRHVDWSVVSVLRGEPGAPDPERVDVTQPLMFAVQYALAERWRALGVEPKAVVGHSFGEVTAAQVAGALSLDEAARIITERGRSLRPAAGRGGLLSIELPAAEVEERLAAFDGRLSVAARNSARATSVSGDLDALGELKAALEAEGITARRVPVAFAAHSAQMEPVGEELRRRLAGVAATSAPVAIYSTVTGERMPGEKLDANYWVENLREPIDFAGAVRRMLADGYGHFVEIAPHPALGPAIETLALEAGVAATTLVSLRRDESGHETMGRSHARLVASGHDPDFSRVFPAGRRVALPTYPFARESYWSAPDAPEVAAADTPFAGTHVEVSGGPARDVFETELDLSDPRFAYLGDHRVAGAVWLPASAFVEMALESAAHLHPGGEWALADLGFEQPLELAEDGAVRLQLVMEPPSSDGVRSFSIASRAAGDPEAPWTSHAAGTLVAGHEGSEATAEPVAAWQARCASPVEMAGVYARFAEQGIEYGEAFRRLEAGWSGAREAIGRLATAPPSPYRVHPTLLDSAFHAGALPGEVPPEAAFVPAAITRVRLGEARAEPAWVTCRLRSVGADGMVIDLQLLDELERLVLEVEGLRVARLGEREGSLFEVRWKPRPPAEGSPRRGGWLILADESGVGEALAERLGSEPLVIARRGSEFRAEGGGRYRIDPGEPGHLTRLVAEAFDGAPPGQIVHLFALDAPPIDSPEALAEVELLCCASTLHLVKAIGERESGAAPRLFLVTRGSQAAGGSAALTAPQQALGWGFGTTVAQEHPELRTTLIDLPDGAAADALWAELQGAGDERWVALRESGRLVPRLVATRPDGEPPRLAAEGAYLVTGGLGGLGRVAAERLADLGARHLAVVGRSDPAAEAREWMDAMRARGVEVHVVRADVADRATLTRALGRLRETVPRIAGVVHAAGVVDDATLESLTADRIARVLAPKVLGTTLLTELVPEADFLVLFSSAAGLLGSPGQSSYSAANAFLDAWAHSQTALGRTALSLDWGAWSEVGMVADSAVRAANTARSGLGSFSREEGGRLFERLLASARPQLVPIALDRGALGRHPELVATRPLLVDLVPTSLEPRDEGDLARRVRAAPEEQRVELLEDYLRGAVAEVSGIDPAEIAPTTSLADLDSLMRVTLSNAIARDLGVELPARRALAAADVRGLARTTVAALASAGPEGGGEGDAAPGAAAEGEGGVPDVIRRPATRDVMRLLRAEEQGTPSVTHNIGFAVRLDAPTTRERLEEILAGLAARHAALRTAIVPDAEHRRLLEVRRRPSGELLRWSRVEDGVDVDERLRALMEPPFDLAVSPLWRFELLESASGEQVLLYGAHHAVSDAASLVLVMAELGAELSGARLGSFATNRDIDALLAAQPAALPADRAASVAEWREQVAGCRRLDLTLARPRPEARTFRAATLFVPVPGGLFERVETEASRLGITAAAFWLGALTAFLARERAVSRFVMAVPVDTRMHDGALDAVGFFGIPIPFAAEIAPEDALVDVLRRADGRLDRVVEKGASFFDAMPALVAEGLYAPNAPLVEVYFNFIRPQVLKARGVEILQAGTGYSDLDLMLSVAPDLGHLRLDYSLDVIDEPSCRRLGQDYLRLVEATCGDPEAPAVTRAGREAAPLTAGPPIETSPAPATETIALAATFALGHLPALLGAALEQDGASGPSLVIEEAPYHQVLASLLDPAGAFRRSSTVAGLALVRGRDLARFGEVTDDTLDGLLDEYEAALTELAARGGGPLIVGFLPDGSGDERLRDWERRLAARVEGRPGIAIVQPDDWTREHPVAQPFDPETDAIAHLPFRPELQAAVALKIAALVRAIRRPPPKVIVVDGDETLWGGVAGEIGPESVDLSGARAMLARRLLDWRAAGVLLVLMSNNDESTVLAVLERPECALGADHFTVVSAGWEPKAERIEAVAAELGLGLDSFVFLDDNPVEIAAVRSALPEVLSITCPAADELEGFLGRLWPVVPRAATREDAARADFYRQEQRRRQVRERTGFAEFLERLELRVDIERMSAETAERAVQLTRRTNQFNLRPGALDAASLARWQSDGEVWIAAARDRFGDYGQIGVLAIRVEGDTLEVVGWLLSCRVLGRGVEERLLGWLADRAQELGCSTVRLSAERTERNVPARRLVAALGSDDIDAPRLVALKTPAELRAFRSWDAGSKEAVGAHSD